MHLTQHTDFALRVLVYLAMHPDETPSTTAIATTFAMNEHHTSAVAKHLVHEGLVIAKRGRTGGLRLAVEPSTVRLGELVRRLEKNLKIVECFDPEENQCPIAPACILRVALEDAATAFFASLDRYTLADLTGNRPRLVKLLKKASTSGA